MGLALGGFARAGAVAVEAGTLARVGETLGGARIEQVEVHAEFERIHAELPEGLALVVEITQARGGVRGACTHHGHTVQPRWELVAPDRAYGDQPPVVATLCDRLEARGEAMALTVPPRPPAQERAQPSLVVPPQRRGVAPWGPLHGVLALLLLSLGAASVGPGRRALMAAGPRAWRDLVLVAALGALVRGCMSPRTVMIGPDAGLMSLIQAWGLDPPAELYGAGFPALMGPIQRLGGFDPAALFHTHLALAILAPPLLWASTRLLLGEGAGTRAAALVAGVGLALSPSHIWLSATEIVHISLLSLELLAVVGALGWARSGAAAPALLAGLAAGFVTHVRPEAVPFPAAPVLLALAVGLPGRGRAWGLVGLGVAGGLTLWRLAGLPPIAESSGPLTPSLYGDTAFWKSVLTPTLMPIAQTPPYFQVFTHARLTPLALPALALVGLAQGLRGRDRVMGALVAWGLLTGGAVVTKSWPLIDGLRLQLPSLAPALALAGLGAGKLLGMGRIQRLPSWAPAAVVALLCLPRLGWVRTSWASHEEFAFLAETLPELPSGALLVFPDQSHHAKELGQVLAALAWRAEGEAPTVMGMTDFLEAGPPASPAGDAPPSGTPVFAFEGVLCRVPEGSGMAPGVARLDPCAELARRCQRVPWRSARITTRTDMDLELAAHPDEGEGAPAEPSAHRRNE